MTNSSRVKKIGLVVFGILILASIFWAQQRPPKLEQVAKTYGLDSYGQIEAIRYTFNIDVPAFKLKAARTWEWEPKTGKVSYEGPDKDGKPVKVTYVRSQLSSQPENVQKEVDPGFTNDNYWLLFPFHAYWDTSATVTDEGTRKLPLGVGSGDVLSVKYPPELGGYTPGDTWDLYIGKDNRVEVLEFHHGGTAKPSLVIATWAGYKKAGPLLVSTEHRGNADGHPLHIFFSDVAVKLTGSDTWVKAE